MKRKLNSLDLWVSRGLRLSSLAGVAMVMALGLSPSWAAEEPKVSDLAARISQQLGEQDYAGCEETLKQIQDRFPKCRKLPQFEYRLGRANKTAKGGDPGRAEELLKNFLPGGSRAESSCAERARFLYADLLAGEGRLDEAKSLLQAACGEDNLGLAERAFKAADTWGMIEKADEIGSWKEALNKALAAAGERQGLGQEWVDQAQDPNGKKQRTARLESDSTALPAVRAALEKLDIRQAGEAEPTRLRRQAFARQKSAEALWRAGKTEEARSVWREVQTLRSRAVGLLPLSPVGASEAVSPEALKARVALGVAKFFLRDYAGSQALMSQIAGYENDVRCQEDADPQAAHDIAQAQMWRIACERIGGAPPEELEPKVRAYLAGGTRASAQLAWGFKMLAELAHLKGDPEQEYLYLKDFKDCVPADRETSFAARRLKELAQSDPDLAASTAGEHSPAYQDIAAQGGITTDKEGRTVFKTFRQTQ